MKQQEEILNYFYTLKEHNCLGVTYCFIGEDFSVVTDIIKLINCQADSYFCNNCWDCKKITQSKHPDLFVVEPSGLTIKIESIREAIGFLRLRSFRLKRKVVVVKNAQSLTPQAQAAFLKTLEEAPDNSFIALCATKLEGLSPTIISRCRKIFLPFESQQQTLSSQGLISEFLAGRDLVFKDRKEFSAFLWGLILSLHSSLLAKTGVRNNQLSNYQDCAIILSSYSPLDLQVILGEVLKIYSAHNSVNMNLALNLIRMKLNQEVNR